MLKQLIFVAFLAFAVYQISNFVDWLGFYQRTYNHKPGTCGRLQGIEHGAEDIQLLPDGLAFISSGVIPQDNDAYRGRVGKIFLFDFNDPHAPPQQLRVVDKVGKDLRLISPLALSVWIDGKTEKTYLYVTQYVINAMDVNKFLFDPITKTLELVRHIPQQPEFRRVNNLVVVGEDQFFYTNWAYAYDALEMLFGIRWGSVGFFDGTKATLVATGLYTPNGIAVSPDGKFLYVALSGVGEIYVFRRDGKSSITFDNSITLGTMPDNLMVDPSNGDIWIGAVPVVYKSLKTIYDPKSSASPSQVIRVKMDDGKATAIDEIYSDDGTQMSGSSVAVVHDNGLLIGSMAGHAVYCTKH